MAPGNQQVVAAYEECGLSPEEIAREFGYDLSVVKQTLLTGSSKFVDACGFQGEVAENKELFNQSDLEDAKGVMKELMTSSEIDMVRLKAATFIIDEAKGRNDIKALKSTAINITEIQRVMNQARSAMARAKEHAIEVSSSQMAIPA